MRPQPQLTLLGYGLEKPGHLTLVLGVPYTTKFCTHVSWDTPIHIRGKRASREVVEQTLRKLVAVGAHATVDFQPNPTEVHLHFIYHEELPGHTHPEPDGSPGGPF